MVLTISRETFDAAVAENAEVFGLTQQEAIQETVKQFETQGVDLSELLRELMISEPESEDSASIDECIEKLQRFLSGNVPTATECDYAKYVQLLRAECEKSLEHRVYAGKKGAYSILLDVLARFDKTDHRCPITDESLKTLTTLMTQQPDLLDNRGIKLMIDYLDQGKKSDTLRLLLKWVRECCVLHEMNRQRIFDAGILDHLKPVLGGAHPLLLRDVLSVLRALVLDDDVRVEFGKAHEHARVIASDTLCEITKLFIRFKQDEQFTYDLMLTLVALLVRTEFCKKLEDAGGLAVVLEALEHFQRSDKLVRQCFKLVKGMAGNDDCKVHFVQQGGAPLVVHALNRHKDSPQTAVAGLGCIAALTLRSPENSKLIFEAGAAEVILASMRQHPENQNVQRNGSWAIRNMVSRSRQQSAQFLELGARELLQEAMTRFKSCEYDLKAALRDLGCDVKLKEEWTGKGGMLHTDAKKAP